MTHTLQAQLFEGIPAVPLTGPGVTRKHAMDAALKRQTEAFKAAFREYARRYYRVNRGTAADVVAMYKLTDLPKPHGDYRATGGIFQAMLRKGEIESVGTVKAADRSGRKSDVYAGVK